MATIDTLLRVKADASNAVRGLQPLQTSLDNIAKDAQVADKALDGLDGAHKVTLNDQAIETARKEITRLRDLMREELRLDPTVDTREAQKRIKQLQSSIKVLSDQEVVIPATVEVDTSGLEALQGTFAAVRSGLASGIGSGLGSALGPLASKLLNVGSAGGEAAAGTRAAAGGIAAVGGAAAAAAATVGAVAIALGITAKVGWELGESAADVETSVAQLEALTGGTGLGEGLFSDLQEWAAATPFAIDDATAAAKRLLAAGVPLKEVNDQLSDMGNISAATGVPLEQIATVFSQMESRGKATFEDLQQLAEAGIPVWGVLADKMGLTVAEVQQLATDGKLGADAIDLVREALNQKWSTAMEEQAKTFNGRMSTLKDTIAQTGQELGTLFLPAMKDLLAVTTALLDPLLQGAKQLAEWNSELEDLTGSNIIQFISPLAGVLHLTAGALDDTNEAAEETPKLIDSLVAAVQQGMTDAQQATQDAADEAERLKEEFEDAIEAFGNIGVDIRTRVSFIIDEDDLKDEIRRKTQGTKDDKPIQLPADLKIGQIGGLTDVQQGLVSDLASFAQMGLEEGARLAEIDPHFDAAGFYRDLRAEIKPLLIAADIDPENVNAFMNNVLGIPAPWKVKPVLQDVAAAEAALPDDVILPVIPEIPQKGKEALEASMGIELGAGPDGLAAVVVPEVDPASLASAQTTLSQLETDRIVNLTVNYIPGVSPPVGFSGGRAPTLSPTNVENSSGVHYPRPNVGTGTPITPRPAPVLVYVDGEEVATHVERHRRPVGSGRRTP